MTMSRPRLTNHIAPGTSELRSSSPVEFDGPALQREAAHRVSALGITLQHFVHLRGEEPGFEDAVPRGALRCGSPRALPGPDMRVKPSARLGVSERLGRFS